MPTRKQLEDALVKAHESGDTEAAQLFAGEINKLPQGNQFLPGMGIGFKNMGLGVQQFGAESAARREQATLRERSQPGPWQATPEQIAEKEQRVKDITQRIGQERQADAPVLDTRSGFLGNLTANILGTLPAMAIPGANTYPGAAAVGGMFGLLSPVGEGESRLQNTAVGGGSGIVGQALGNTVGTVLGGMRRSLTPEAEKLAGVLEGAGVSLNPAQRTGSKVLANVNAALENMPFSGGAIAKQKAAQQEAFNTAATGLLGRPSGEVTKDVIETATKDVGKKFTDLASRNTLIAGDQFTSRLGSVQAEINRQHVSDVAKVANNYVDDILGKIRPDETIPGDVYRTLDSSISRRIRETNNGDLRNALGGIRGVLREGMDNSIAPTDQAAWRTVRNTYADLQRISETAGKSPTGQLSPGLLFNEVRNRPASQDLRVLAQAGKEFLPSKVSDSGTAQRAFYQNLLTGGALGGGLGGIGLMRGESPEASAGYAALGLLSPLVIQTMINSPAGRALLVKGLTGGAMPPLADEAIRAGVRGATIGTGLQYGAQ
jgi:hypothetical protein